MTLHGIRTLLVLLVNISFFSAPAFPEDPVRLPELSYKRLLSGLQVTVAATPNLGESMTIGLSVPHGSAFDPAEKSGLANLVTRMFVRATIDKTLADIQEELSYLGATIEARCDWDSIRFLLRGQSSKFERSLLLFYQVAGEAQFNEADFASVKQQILQQLQKPADPRQQIHAEFGNVLFSGTTYGRPLEGTPAALKNMTLGDIRYFYRRYFSPSDASLVIVGNVPAHLVLQKATRIWGVWVRKDEVPFSFVPPRKPKGRNIFLKDDPNSPAAQFILGNIWPRREDPAYYAAVLAARILQERLTKLLPTSLLTVGSEGRRMTGPFFIQGQAAADQAVGEIQKIQDTAEEMKVSPVAREELTAAQNRWIEEFNKDLGTTGGTCSVLLDSELYRLGTNYLAAFPNLVRRFDASAIKQAAADWIFPGGIDILVSGPASSLKPVLEPLGSFRQVAP